MRRSLIAADALLLAAVTAALWAQSIATDGSIETNTQLVSKIATGTAPLDVSSSTTVENLSADRLDGHHGYHYAYVSDLDALDNPDRPCFDLTHRFVDCGNGTVTDTVTGLIWLENANCFGEQSFPTANESAAGLEDSECGLTDGSRPGDWRLPTKEEWWGSEWVEGILKESCTDDPKIVGNGSPDTECYSDHPAWASGVVSSSYWSSSTEPALTVVARTASLDSGNLTSSGKPNPHYVWPVRGGQ